MAGGIFLLWFAFFYVHSTLLPLLIASLFLYWTYHSFLCVFVLIRLSCCATPFDLARHPGR